MPRPDTAAAVRPDRVTLLLTATRSGAVSSVLWTGVADHRPGPSVFRDVLKARRLVEATRWIVLGNTKADGRVALSDAGVDEVVQERPSYPLPAMRRDDSDGELGDLLRDEPVAVARFGVRAVPRRPDRSILLGDQAEVAGPAIL